MIVSGYPDLGSQDDTDDRLLRRASAGDKQAVSEIYQRYFEPLYHFLRLRVADSQTAEDLTSSVFEKLIDTLRRGKGPQQHLRGWLFKVARSALYDYYGQTAAQPPDESLEDWHTLETDDAPETQVIRLLDIETIRSALGMLSPDQLDVLLLRFDQQLSLQETAAITGKNLNTVKTLQLRALQKLRQIVQRKSRGGR